MDGILGQVSEYGLVIDAPVLQSGQGIEGEGERWVKKTPIS